MSVRLLFLSAVLSLIASTAGAAGPTYTAIGASDAVGYGASNFPAVPNNGYVYRITDWLKARYPFWTLSNRGGSGFTAVDMVNNSLNPAIADHPRLVTVWAGANDVKDSVLANETTDTFKARFETAYTTIIRRLRQETGAVIVTANLPDLSRIPVAAYLSAAQRTLGQNDSLAANDVITRVAAAYSVPVVDLYSDPQSYNPANFYTDGFHPNDAGYLNMATAYEATIQANAWRVVSGLGDVNGDGSISAADAVATLGAAAGLANLADRPGVAADTTPPGGDGRIGIADAVQTLRRTMGLVPDASWR